MFVKKSGIVQTTALFHCKHPINHRFAYKRQVPIMHKRRSLQTHTENSIKNLQSEYLTSDFDRRLGGFILNPEDDYVLNIVIAPKIIQVDETDFYQDIHLSIHASGQAGTPYSNQTEFIFSIHNGLKMHQYKPYWVCAYTDFFIRESLPSYIYKEICKYGSKEMD